MLSQIQEARANRSAATPTRVAGWIVALLALAASLTMWTSGTAVAAPVTSTITNPLSSTQGSLANGVTWTRNGDSLWKCTSRTFTFDHEVDVVFGINKLNAPESGGEGVIVPVGSQAVSISSSHVWNAATRRVSRTNNNEAATSTFKMDNITSLTLTGIGGCGWNRNVAFIDVTYDNAPLTVTVNGPADGATYEVGDVVNADFACADDLAVASCVGDQTNGSVIDTSVAGTFTFTTVATDNSGETTSKTVTYTVAPVVAVPMFDSTVLAGVAVGGLLLGGMVLLTVRRRLVR